MSRTGARSVSQRVGNRGRERSLDRTDAFTTYVMDRLLHRLGRSRHAKELYLKGGLLVANLVDSPHRFTRDIDVLKRRGRPSADDLRRVFREIVCVAADDGIVFPKDGVRAQVASRDEDGYDGVKVFVRASVGQREVDLRVDVGLGDAVVPPASRRSLAPFSWRRPSRGPWTCEQRLHASTPSSVPSSKPSPRRPRRRSAGKLASRPESVREAEEVPLVDGVEHLDHRLLDDLVLQRGTPAGGETAVLAATRPLVLEVG